MRMVIIFLLISILFIAACNGKVEDKVIESEGCCRLCLESFSQYPGAQGPEAVYCSQIVTEGSCAEEFNIKDITVQNCLEKN